MTKIDAFQGYRYNPEKVGDLSLVMAPPYDVIDAALQDKLYAKSPYNVVRIDLAKEENDLNRYAVSQHAYTTWKQKDILRLDEKPSIYLYFQTYSLPDGRRLTRRVRAFTQGRSCRQGGLRMAHITLDDPETDRMALDLARFA